MSDPYSTLIQALGYEMLQPAESYLEKDHTTAVFKALREIGVQEERLPEFADKVARAGLLAGPRDIPVGNRISAEKIENAVAAIGDGLTLLHQGLHTISVARETATPGSLGRIEHLAPLHAAVLGAIADAVGKAIGAGHSLDDKIADSVPAYWAGGRKDPWSGVFELAAARVKRIGEAIPRQDYHAKKKDRDAWLGRLVPELGRIYEEVTGKSAEISNPGDKAGLNWRCPFARFVEGLWGYLDMREEACPGDDKIKGALTRPAAPIKTTQRPA